MTLATKSMSWSQPQPVSGQSGTSPPPVDDRSLWLADSVVARSYHSLVIVALLETCKSRQVLHSPCVAKGPAVPIPKRGSSISKYQPFSFVLPPGGGVAELGGSVPLCVVTS